MTRKDTIIAAVLVNAGLLIILFSTALKSNTQEPSYSATVAPTMPPVKEDVVVKKEVAPSAGDEVDQILKQYGNATAAVSPAPADQSAFAKDLQSITVPETPIVPASPLAVMTPVAVVPEIAAVHLEKSSTEYKVKKGDVLEKIARHHQCTVDEIMKMNHLNSTYLKIGQVLKIPSKAAGGVVASKVPAKATGSVASSGPKYYTVKNGDNPWTIAVKNHMKVEELLKLNNLDEEKARKLKPGDQLLISR